MTYVSSTWVMLRRRTHYPSLPERRSTEFKFNGFRVAKEVM